MKRQKRGQATDPTGLSSGSYRVFRGGGWLNYARDCRCAYRSWVDPGRRFDNPGLRLVRAAD